MERAMAILGTAFVVALIGLFVYGIYTPSQGTNSALSNLAELLKEQDRIARIEHEITGTIDKKTFVEGETVTKAVDDPSMPMMMPMGGSNFIMLPGASSSHNETRKEPDSFLVTIEGRDYHVDEKRWSALEEGQKIYMKYNGYGVISLEIL